MKTSLHNKTIKKDQRRNLRKNQTPQEGKLWSLLRNRNMGYKFKRQYSIGPYIVDFFCSEKRLVIEVDGSQHAENKEYDDERTRFLQGLDCTVLRFWNNDIDKNINGVMMRIQEVLEITPPHPNPLLHQEREPIMQIHNNKQLKNLNTFGVEATAKYFAEINSIQDFEQLITMDEFKNHQRLIVGGGSNMLLTQDIDGLVIKNNLLGKEILEEDEEVVTVKIMSGENWHEAVLWATDHGWGGFENLALIPGSVGATPVQNIGAYGVEIKDTIDRVGVIDMQTGEIKELTNIECNFGYRDSMFKNEAKGKYFITYVIFQLSKIASLNTDYGVLKNQLQEMGIATPTMQNVRDAVIAIRKSKLPDPKQIGNAGSFFKNPVVSETDFKRLQKDYPDVPFFDAEQGIKIPAGWLIEQCGWKGKRVGNVGVHEKQALVLVNYGNATGQEIKSLAEAVQGAVYEKFGIHLEAEVTMI